MPFAKQITVSYNGICRLCRNQILAGEMAWFERPIKGKPGILTCERCYDAEQKA